MILTPSIIAAAKESILCWLATVDTDGMPNVSPKEVWCHYKSDTIIIANIASPRSEQNIIDNSKVCLSFINILTQRGYQLKGEGKVVTEADMPYADMRKELEKITQGYYPFAHIFAIQVKEAKEIIAPSYMLFPNETVEEKVRKAQEAYNILHNK